MFGLRWTECDRSDRLVTKEKNFKTREAMDKFIEKVVEKDNFIRLEATCER